MSTTPIEQTEKTGKLTTLLISLFFGIWGLIPALVFGNKLTAAGRSQSPVWKSFGIGVAINFVFWVIVYFAMGAAFFAAVEASKNR